MIQAEIQDDKTKSMEMTQAKNVWYVCICKIFNGKGLAALSNF